MKVHPSRSLAIIVGTFVFLGSPALSGFQAQEKNGSADAEIAFESDRNGQDDIYIMNADGSYEKRLTSSSSDGLLNLRPVWSPDCRSIVFTKLWTKPTHHSALYVMASDGTNVRPFRQVAGSVADWEPTWSPDGTEVAFVSDQDGNPDIYVAQANGTHVRQLTSSKGADKHSWNPAWSPRGDEIVFDSNHDGGDEIYKIKIASRAIQRLTHTAEKKKGNWTPSWSSDGRRIVFSANRDAASGRLEDPAQYGIYVMDREGSNVQRLSYWDDAHPKWSPDDSKILFEASRDGRKKGALYVMWADGTHVQCITPDPSEHRHADWCRRTSFAVHSAMSRGRRRSLSRRASRPLLLGGDTCAN